MRRQICQHTVLRNLERIPHECACYLRDLFHSIKIKQAYFGVSDITLL
jgi:hypothetical protein